MQVQYDSDADALYVEFLADAKVARTAAVDARRNVDYDGDDQVVGIELLAVSAGIDLDGLPHAAEIGAALRDLAAATPR